MRASVKKRTDRAKSCSKRKKNRPTYGIHGSKLIQNPQASHFRRVQRHKKKKEQQNVLSNKVTSKVSHSVWNNGLSLSLLENISKG